MDGLRVDARLDEPDEIYAEIMEAVRGLDAEASLRFCARLVLLLANQVADPALLKAAVQAARESGGT